jgi:hypothetical protein
MADYHTRFACILPLGTADNVARALQLYFEFDLEKSTEGETLGFNESKTPCSGYAPPPILAPRCTNLLSGMTLKDSNDLGRPRTLLSDCGI